MKYYLTVTPDAHAPYDFLAVGHVCSICGLIYVDFGSADAVPFSVVSFKVMLQEFAFENLTVGLYLFLFFYQ